MIFDDLAFLDNLPLEAYGKHFGSADKPKNSSRKFRSNMMLNPLNFKHLNSIDNNEADMITLNLEDAIAPSRKKEALYNIALFLSHLEASKSFVIVRTNPIDAGGAEEIAFLNNFGFDAVRIPKVKNELEIARALTLLAPNKELHISVETKEAFANLPKLHIDERLTVANLGILDLLSSLGLPQSIVQIGNPTIDYILAKFLIDAKSCGILPISFMFQDYKDTAAFKQWCQYEKRMGFGTKACMGPAQVAIANEVFELDSESIKRAIEIKELFEEHSQRGIHGFMHPEHGFIDEPIYKDACITLGLE